MTQSYGNHAHQPIATIVGNLFLIAALTAFGLRWFGIGGRTTFALGLFALVGAIATTLVISRLFTTRLQDRIIRLEMRVRALSLLTPAGQRQLDQCTIKQIAALRFASDSELPALLERTVRENLKPNDIKRAVTTWIPDHDRT